MDIPQDVAVVGGTGKTGRRVADRLRSRGVAVRPLARSTDPTFDWNRPETWAPALRGADAAFVTYQPDLAVPGAAETIAAFTAAAVGAGVRRFVLLSGRGEPRAAAAERCLQGHAPEWTVLRCAWFAQNFSEHFLHPAVEAGVIALPAPDVAEPFVSCDDIANAAVEVLCSGRHHERTYEVLDGRNSTVCADLPQLLGRPATDFASYARAAATAGAWSR